MTDRESRIEALRRRVDGEGEERWSDLLAGLTPEDIASLLRELDDHGVELAILGLHAESRDLCNEVLPLLDRHDVARLLGVLSDPVVAELLADVPVDDATWMLELLDEERVPAVVALLPAQDRKEAAERLEQPEGSASRLMSDEFIAAPETATAGEAIAALRGAGEKVTINYVYLVDAERRLRGVASLRRLLRVTPETPLRGLTPENVVAVNASDDQEHVAQVFAQHDFVAMPVVDESRRIVGVVTHDDVLDVMREEATEDILHMAGTTAEDVISQSVWTSARARMPWLLLCLGSGILSLRILDGHEERLGAAFVALSLFVPVIIGMAGNVGTQAATLVMRGLATGRFRQHDSLPVLWREIRTATVIGTAYGALLGAVACLALDREASFGLVVGASLLACVALASFLGTLLPLAFHAIGVDPAVATGPLVTTSMDVVGIATYFSLATWLLA